MRTTLPTGDDVPRWVTRLLVALLVYVVGVGAWMLSAAGGATVQRYLGLLADGGANLGALVLALAASRRLSPGPVRRAWWCLAVALGLYLAGTVTGTSLWLRGRDPFPGFADFFFLAFYPVVLAGVLFFLRARAIRVPWARFALDASILVVGFGAFFWFLVIRPAPAVTHIDVLRQVLSQAYVALSSLLLLAFGVVLLAGPGETGSRRVPLLLLAGFTTMFLGDIVWALAKVSGGYLPGGLQDVLYTACYVPMAAAAREAMRRNGLAVRTTSLDADAMVHALPYGAMLVAFVVLVYFARADVSGPVASMTMIVFVLTLLVMARQSAMLRVDARMREQWAAEIVEARYASLIANAADVILIVDAAGALRFASPAGERTFGLKPEPPFGDRFVDLWSGGEREQLDEFLELVGATTSGTVGPVELRLERGAMVYTVEIVGSNLTQDPAVRGLALNLRDVSQRKALEDQLRERAFHDPLTGLANRNLFSDRVEHALAIAHRSNGHVAVMFLDLDDFKNINDTLGHDAGDRLLESVAARLVRTTRASDTVARLAGDEFAVLLEGIRSREDVERPAAVLVDALGAPYPLGGGEVEVGTSIGVAISTNDSVADELLSNADIAMYNAKAAGKNRYIVFEPHMQEALRERLRLEADISRALENGEFFLEYQPVVDLRTMRLLGVEALARWLHPERGVLMPRQFIAVAEDSGQIIELGRWVLRTACRDWRRWCSELHGGAPLHIALNISGRHLQQDDLVRDVAEAIAQSGIEPGRLLIELTESSIMHNTEVNLERLGQLKRLGVRLAVDDFGTGYSSLSYLHRFPIDVLKIDRSFVGRLAIDGDGPELARAVVRLGETLGLETVAEGVESEEQLAALVALGCFAGQGFLFSPAIPLDRLATTPFVLRAQLRNVNEVRERLA